MADLTVKSTAFEQGQLIPKKYTCDGEDVNPPLTIEGIPKEAKTLALIMDDPDAPGGTFDHWVIWNISAQTSSIAEHSAPGKEGKNGFGKVGYNGPCPPPGTHRYFFKMYALDAELKLGSILGTPKKKDLEKAMQGHILAKGELMGTYHR